MDWFLYDNGLRLENVKNLGTTLSDILLSHSKVNRNQATFFTQ